MEWMYNLNGNDIWTSDRFTTKEEAIEAAKEEMNELEKYDGVPYGDNFSIGQISDYVPYVSAEDVIDQVTVNAYEACGEVSESWLSKPGQDEMDLLQKKLDSAVSKWLKEIKEYPTFGQVVNIEEIKR
ncbi:hypothetical protein RGU74_27205 [Bacillus cereus]|uniref:hypothetical protein n=1 Tax=Bacillus cereus TaxID=1396 RepID=UPI0028532120|nr:hypothetical protein [Bacillus cereus]MDR4987187.1 hypothetical protein [Bacillus cereus]